MILEQTLPDNTIDSILEKKKKTELQSFVFGSSYGQYLRNTYSKFISLEDDERQNLLHTAEIFRINEQKSSLALNFAKATVSIIIYGQVQVKGKKIVKGNYFYSEVEKLQIDFLKKTSLVMIDRASIEESLGFYEEFYTKMDYIKRLKINFPNKVLRQLTRRSILVQKESYFQQKFEKGIYILLKGDYILVDEADKLLIQIIDGYYGEEWLWSEQPKYFLKAKSMKHSYLWINITDFLNNSTAEEINFLKRCHEQKKLYYSELSQRKKTINLKFKNYKLGIVEKSKEKANEFGIKVKKQYTLEEKREMDKLIQTITQSNWESKWKQEENILKTERQRQLKQRRYYIPKKTKSKYFSTLREKHFSQDLYFGKSESTTLQFKPKMHLHQRTHSQGIFNRGKTAVKDNKFTAPTERIYSLKYDRTISNSFTNLQKMRRYDQLKKTSTLRRGQTWLTIQQEQKNLQNSLFQLRSLSMSAKLNKDPEKLRYETMRRTQILINKKMQSGNLTWR